MDWISTGRNKIEDYINLASFDVSSLYLTDFLDVSETITELSYLTHNYFRYYGKFPSKVAKYIIETLTAEGAIAKDQDFIFDNYNGSGTTMVEAKIAGFSSGGIDINPFGVLAANVKTYNYSVDRLHYIFSNLMLNVRNHLDSDQQRTLFDEPDDGNFEHSNDISSLVKQMYIDFPDIEKWFCSETIYQLSIIKYYLLQLPYDKYREFFSLGFFAIIRRVSKAHDAEVRPHVNPQKKPRNAIEAYEKKINEMISAMQSWNIVTCKKVDSHTFLCDNGDHNAVIDIIKKLRLQYCKDLGLVVSHPPYLNCFDYIPVYRLKFLWAFGFDEIYGEQSYQQIKSKEIRSYPATTDTFVNNYFQHNLDAYRIIYEQLKPGGYCCIVIGDCTIGKQLFSVHKMFIKGMESIGFTVKRVTYRSTSYGLGRYAYRHKADYNDKEDGKKDAIIFFQK